MLSKAVVLNFSFSHQQHHSTSAPEPHRRAVWQRHLAGLTGLTRPHWISWQFFFHVCFEAMDSTPSHHNTFPGLMPPRPFNNKHSGARKFPRQPVNTTSCVIYGKPARPVRAPPFHFAPDRAAASARRRST